MATDNYKRETGLKILQQAQEAADNIPNTQPSTRLAFERLIKAVQILTHPTKGE